MYRTARGFGFGLKAGLPGDFVDGEAFGDRIHHLSHEKSEPTIFILLQDTGAAEVTVEIFEGLLMGSGFGWTRRTA